MFGSAKSRIYHTRPDCRACYVRNPILLDTLVGKRPCGRCVPEDINVDRCTACYGVLPSFLRFACDHKYCQECGETILSTQVQGKRATIRCPCPNAGVLDKPSTQVVDALLMILNQKSANAPPAASSILDRLNMQCPHCDAVFYDFDGCLALRCSCDRYFCALCLAKCDTNEDMHAHVRSCTHNPTGEYFLSSAAWEAMRQQNRTKIGHTILTERRGLENLSSAHALITQGVSVHAGDVDILRSLYQLFWIVATSYKVTLCSIYTAIRRYARYLGAGRPEPVLL